MHIGACLLSAAQREPDVRELLEQVDGWGAFISPGGALTTWEALQSKPLGGLAPARGSDNESDDDDEIDASTMERVLAAQAAAARGDHDVIQDDEDDEEGGHSSEYLQHFAQYLSNRNFLNQTDTGNDEFGGGREGGVSSEAWTAEFDDFDIEGPSGGAPPSASSAVSSATGAIDGFDDFDDDEGASSGGAAGGDTTAGGSGNALNLSSDQWAADFESLSSSAAAADGGMDGGWAAFDPAPPTGPAASFESAPSAEAPASAPAAVDAADADDSS